MFSIVIAPEERHEIGLNFMMTSISPDWPQPAGPSQSPFDHPGSSSGWVLDHRQARIPAVCRSEYLILGYPHQKYCRDT